MLKRPHPALRATFSRWEKDSRVALRLLILLMLSLQASAQQPSASVSGYVLEATTARPVEGVEVAVYVDGTRTTMTDSEGRFSFNNLSPGTHSFGIYKPGYASENIRYGNRRFTLVAGPTRELVFRIQRTGTLSGRVLDANGRPAVQVNVTVLRFDYREFRKEPIGVSRFLSRDTDDRGEFRVFDVPAGDYFVLVDPRGTPAGAALYPGEREVRRAEHVEVRPAWETRLRDMTLPLPMRGVIRLHIVNATGAPLPESVGVGAVATGNSVSSAFLSVNEVQGNDPTIRRFQPLLVGSYVFHSAFQSAAGNIAGYARVDYSGADVDADFVLGKLTGRIKGKVLLESSDGSTKPLSGAEMEFFGMNDESGFSAADGTFNVPGLLNGPFEFSGAFEMPSGYYVSSVRARDNDVLKNGLVVSENTPELEVRVRVDGGSLEGTVADTRGRAAPDAVVALVPLPPLLDRTDRQDTYRIRRAPTGSFVLEDIVPGEYEIYAWADAPQDAVMDPWFMDKFKGRGTRVRVEPGAKLKMELRILDE